MALRPLCFAALKPKECLGCLISVKGRNSLSGAGSQQLQLRGSCRGCWSRELLLGQHRAMCTPHVPACLVVSGLLGQLSDL